jgi:hypothetical protein
MREAKEKSRINGVELLLRRFKGGPFPTYTPGPSYTRSIPDKKDPKILHCDPDRW